MIYDCFLFWKELDILEIRMEILDPVVDVFVIVESDKTFSGKDKDLFYLKNADRFKKFWPKIRHFVIRDTPVLSDGDRWKLETFQRNSILKALQKNSPLDEDYVMISDVDEIPNPEKVKNRLCGVYKMLRYDYFLNTRVNQIWMGTYGCKADRFKSGLMTAEEGRRNRFKMNPIDDGGWHFSWIGSSEMMREKIEAFSHSEYDNDGIKNDIDMRIETLTDIMGRNNERMVVVPISADHLPNFLVEKKERYSKLFYLP